MRVCIQVNCAGADPFFLKIVTKMVGKVKKLRQARLPKGESYESKDTLKANSLRSSFSKSYSFGGYDQNQPNQRVLTKQDSGSSVSSRVSPSSSGYKSQSQRSDTTMSATPSPTATPHLPNQLLGQGGALSPEPDSTVMWAVTNMSAVPAGSVLINPQVGKPGPTSTQINNANSYPEYRLFPPDNKPTNLKSKNLTTQRSQKPTTQRSQKPTIPRFQKPTSENKTNNANSYPGYRLFPPENKPTTQRSQKPTTQRPQKPTIPRFQKLTSEKKIDNANSYPEYRLFPSQNKLTTQTSKKPTTQTSKKPTTQTSKEPTTQTSKKPTTLRFIEPDPTLPVPIEDIGSILGYSYFSTPSPGFFNQGALNQQLVPINEEYEHPATEECKWCDFTFPTGEPYTNEDGSIYHFDPANPPNLERKAPTSIPRQYQNGTNGEVAGSAQEQSLGVDQVAVPVPAAPPIAHAHTDNEGHPHAVGGNESGPVLHHLGHGPMPPMHSQPVRQYPTHLVMPPPNTEPPPMYTPAPMLPAPMGYDRLPIMDGNSPEMCNYLMNLSLADGRGDSSHRPVFYCPSTAAPAHAHYPQGSGPAVPMYLAPAPPRYPYTYAVTPYPPADPTRTAAPECSYSQPQVHAYYARCPSTQVNGGPSYCQTNGSSGMVGLVPLPQVPAPAPPRPYHRPPLPTPPMTPQNGCPLYSNGYAAMPGCYPHYQPANPPMLRPALQLNVSNSPRSEPDSTPHSASPLRFSAPGPLYRFTYPSRPRMGGVSNGSRPALVGAASQQQAALASAIETAGLAAQAGGYHIMTSP